MASTNNSVLKQLIEAENFHDLEKMLALMTDDVIVEDVPFGIVRKGKGSVKQGFAALFNAIPDFKVEPKSWISNDKSFAVEAIFTGTQTGDLHGLPATGKGFSVRVCQLWRISKWQGKGKKRLLGLSNLGKAAGRRAKVTI